MSRYVIVGCGAAGNAAAETIRKLEPEAEIRMFSREGRHYYYRPALPEYLAGEKTLRGFTLHDGAWYEKNGIEVHLSTEIVDIRAPEKTVQASDGKTYPYDRLLLATGSRAVVPDVPGRDIEGVFTLHTADDADAMLRRAETAMSLVVIGGGILGIEAGNGLRKRGLQVAVVGRNKRLLPKQMDAAGAVFLQRRLEEMGFTFHLGVTPREIARLDGRLAVRLQDGRALETDMVLLSAGAVPDLALARKLGLAIGKAVQVDDRLRTSLDDIFAAGDLVEHRGVYYGIWPAAMAQGRAAGANMAGKETIYEGTLQSHRLKVAGIDLVSMGDIDAEGGDACVVRSDEEKCIYRKLVIENRTVAGAILLGDLQGVKEIQAAVEGRKALAAVRETMQEQGFDLSGIE
ncbi:MAG: NAD(P)/FAD-dependent oxidoreductase [Syntrophaceae bacterium]|nr:NAD(P)/FAD-dependent oxidoreductase [Syntrophaceae bacterium]